MPAASVRWSLRLPWSSARRVQHLVRLDAPGQVGEVLGRAIAHLLDQPDPTIVALVTATAARRAAIPQDRTQVCSWRLDRALVDRVVAYLQAHAGLPASHLVDAAIRCYASVCEGRGGASQAPGLSRRRYQRLCRELVVVIEGGEAGAHAA